jgi:hypothetical protein
MMNRVNAAFALEDKDAAMAEMKAIGEACEKGDFGLLSMVMSPAFSKILETKFKGEAMVADRIKSLEALASGAQKPEEAANAALWYLQAIEIWQALPAQTRQAILAFAPTIDNPPPAPVAAALDESQAAFEVFREASSKRRCDFSVFVPRRGYPPIAPHYAPGMHELQRALRADAARLLASGQREQAVEVLGAIIRASAHLGNDANLACCRLAHVNFSDTLDLIEAAVKAHKIDVRSAPQLADAAGRISRKDPFGYLDCISKTRETFTRGYFGGAPSGEQANQEYARQVEIMRQFNGDQTFFVLIILDEFTRRANDKGPPPDATDWQPGAITLPETIERLGGVIDPGAEQAIRAQYDEVIARLNHNDWEFFVGREVTAAARLVESLARARADLRRATRLLMLPDDPQPAAPADTAKP